jgi:hypothetical protein
VWLNVHSTVRILLAVGVVARVTLFSTRISAVAHVCDTWVSEVKVVAPILLPAAVCPSLGVILATPLVALAIARQRSFKVPVGILSGRLNWRTAGASAASDATTPTPSRAPAVLVFVAGI